MTLSLSFCSVSLVILIFPLFVGIIGEQSDFLGQIFQDQRRNLIEKCSSILIKIRPFVTSWPNLLFLHLHQPILPIFQELIRCFVCVFFKNLLQLTNLRLFLFLLWSVYWRNPWVPGPTIRDHNATEAGSILQDVYLNFLYDFFNVLLGNVEESETFFWGWPQVWNPIDMVVGAKLVEALIDAIKYRLVMDFISLSLLDVRPSFIHELSVKFLKNLRL